MGTCTVSPENRRVKSDVVGNGKDRRCLNRIFKAERDNAMIMGHGPGGATVAAVCHNGYGERGRAAVLSHCINSHTSRYTTSHTSIHKGL